MTRKSLVISTIFSAALLCSVTLAQDPVEDIDKGLHPNLAQASTQCDWKPTSGYHSRKMTTGTICMDTRRTQGGFWSR